MAREVGAPGVGGAGRQVAQTPGPQRPPDPRDCSSRVAVDATGGDDDDAPPLVVDRLAPVEVGLPLRLALDVLAAVVLDDDARSGSGQVVLADRIAVVGPDGPIDLRLG